MLSSSRLMAITINFSSLLVAAIMYTDLQVTGHKPNVRKVNLTNQISMTSSYMYSYVT